MFERFSHGQEQMVTPEFLAEQVRLPRDQWSWKFKRHIEGIVQENIRMREGKWTKEERNPSPEVEKEATYKRYLSGLRLDEDELRNKVILDLGSGDGEFVKYCIDKGVTPNAYGIEGRLVDENNTTEETSGFVKIDEQYRKNFFTQNYGEAFPVHNADYVVSVASVTNMDWDGEWADVVRVLENSLAALKDNGEIRLWPIQEVIEAETTSEKGVSGTQQKWKERFNEFARVNNLEWEIRPTGVIVTGNDNDQIYLNSVLVLRK